jgi:nitrate reductase NapE
MRPRELIASEERPIDRESESTRRTEEFRSWLFLTFVMAPLLAVVLVAGYGFVVWMYQLVAGPPGV